MFVFISHGCGQQPFFLFLQFSFHFRGIFEVLHGSFEICFGIFLLGLAVLFVVFPLTEALTLFGYHVLAF